MAVCELCEQEVGLAYSCMKRLKRQIPFGGEPRPAITGPRCMDCRVGVGGFHHPGCRMELCPRCGGRLRFCGCEVAQNDRKPAPGAWRRRLAKGGVRPAYNRKEGPLF
jgi:hypothetical protein